MDFKGFYDEIIFDVDKSILKSYTGKQGDTKSRGLYVAVTQKNAAIEDLTGLSMRLFYEKPDKTRGFIDGVVDGNKFRIDYTNQMYAVPGVVKAELRLMGSNEEIITAKTFKILVDSSIADGSVVSENERGILDRAFELAEDIIPRLELLDVELLEDVQVEMLGARHSNIKDEIYESLGARLDESEQDLLDHKAEYASQRQQDHLKVAKVEKELNDYQKVMSMVNVNQEPKQKTTGYGVISLPPNAANGQVSAVVKGRTLKQEFNYNKDTMEQWSIPSNSTKGESKITLKGTGGYPGATLPVFVKPNTKYGILYTVLTSNVPSFHLGAGTYPFTEAAIPTHLGNVKIITTTKESWTMNLFRFFLAPDSTDEHSITISTPRMFELPPGSEIETDFNTLSADQLAQKYPYISGDSVKSTIGAFRIRSVSEDETQESSAYVIATDADTGEILELRSLPSGTKDEIRVADNKLIKRVSDEVFLDGSENWTLQSINEYGIANFRLENLNTILPNASFKAPLEGKFTVSGFKQQTSVISVTTEEGFLINDFPSFYIRVLASKLPQQNVTGFKAWLQANPITLTYQLAEPEIIPIQVSGSLTSHPNGTVYVEPFVVDAGVYADKIEVLHQDLPIKAIEKVSKVDFMTGVETELDIDGIVIAENKLSFTHPELQDGGIVFFEYEYDREGTTPETEIEYYDSRYTIKDSVTDKFYKWNIVVANGQPSIELVEV